MSILWTATAVGNLAAIHEYIDRELARVSKLFVESQRPRLDMERLNTLYRSLLKS